MTKTGIAFLSIVLIFFFTGCAQKTLYDWGRYDQRLYQYYKNPDNIDDLKKELYETIESNRESDTKVAPGLYAEYGYLLLEAGEVSEAILFFEKEKELWPESRQFMDKMIDASRAEAN